MGLFEEIGFVQDKSKKLFLCVDDFSTEAMGLYKALGYQEIGPIPDMFIPGVITYLMMKTRD
jgi:ribosomal protein S18 acetylase RimI-like enzyme